MKDEKSTADPYWDVIQQEWESILKWYLMFAEKKPVMLYDIQEKKVYAYPYREFWAELNTRSQLSLAEQYQKAVKNEQIVVFVRDNVNEKLASYTVRLEKPQGKRRRK